MHYKFPILFLSLLVLQTATKPACWKKKGRRAVKNWRAFWEQAQTLSKGKVKTPLPAWARPSELSLCFFLGGGAYQAQEFLWDCGEMPQFESWQ